jgi:uncharacterized protein (TIGR03435 family)
VRRSIIAPLRVFCAAWGQTFDVASVRANGAPLADGQTRGISATPTSVTARAANLLDCIQWAWQVREFEVAGPEWIRSERWDIAARAGSPAGADELRGMMRSLLEDRFGLRLHREEKEMSVYALTVGRRGSKLRASAQESSGMSKLPGGGLRLEFRRTTVAELANFLSTLAAVDRPVEDRSGLGGVYDFRLDLHEVAGPWGSEAERAAAPSLGTVLEEQLGLRLEGRRAPVEVLVVDRVQRPSGNKPRMRRRGARWPTVITRRSPDTPSGSRRPRRQCRARCTWETS